MSGSAKPSRWGSMYSQRWPSLLFGDYPNLILINWHSQHLLSHLKCSLFFKSDSQVWQFPSTCCQFSGWFCRLWFLSFCLLPWSCLFFFFLNLSDVLFPGATCINPTLSLSSSPWILCHWLLGLGDLGTRVLATTCGPGPSSCLKCPWILSPCSPQPAPAANVKSTWSGSDFKRSGKNILISLSLPGLRSQIPDVPKPSRNYSIYI